MKELFFCLSMMSIGLVSCADNPSAGQEGGPCYGNGTCDTGLSCVNQTCVGTGPSGLVDLLIVMDNSGSMAGEQQAIAAAFRGLTQKLDEKLGIDKYRIALVTIGVESPQCPACLLVDRSCMNETGEGGRFQDRLGHYSGTSENPIYDFQSDPSCRVISSTNQKCLYDSTSERGVLLDGLNGCGYDRGLSPIRLALGPSLLNNYNKGFLREAAKLVVVVVSDEDDCGEVGDVSEDLLWIGGNICYYAAKGTGPNGETSYPDDPTHRPYQLTAVSEYKQFLSNLKNNNDQLVKFAAIVGVLDPGNPSTTTIEYDLTNPAQPKISPVCQTPGCTGAYCSAYPGTRYIQLAQLFGIGQNGFIDTICQSDYTATINRLADFITAP